MNRVILIILSAFIVCSINCKKEEIIFLPQVVTSSADEIFSTSAKVGGRIIDNGGDEISEQGIYWGTTPDCKTTGTKLSIEVDSNTFYLTLGELDAGIKYYVTAYATNSAGTAFGTETFFTTRVNFPIVSTSTVSNMTEISATVGGNVTDDGGFAVSERGIFWGDMPDPVSNGQKVIIGSGTGEYSSEILGLSKGNMYYVRAFATNIKGTALGEEIDFSLNSTLPIVFTSNHTGVSTFSAILSGSVSSNGGSSVSERGFLISTSSNPETSGTSIICGSGLGIYSASIDTLKSKTTYFYLAYATNAVGTNYGLVDSFSTTGDGPIVSVLNEDNLTRNSATLYGLVNANELNTTVSFEYGTTTAYGTSVNAIENPITGTNNDTVHVNISGLTMNTVYHYRIRAENEQGISYSEDFSFTTVKTGYASSISDIDGNTYSTIGIGYQEWMTVNLRTTTLNDGTAIDSIGLGTQWSTTFNSGYCIYANASNIDTDYGLLYNWYTVETDKICPTGWHVPSNEDIIDLVNYLGGNNVAGGKLKESGTNHWKTPNTDANDEYDFTALPGGIRDRDSTFYYKTLEGSWWTKTEYSSNTARFYKLLYEYGNLFQAYIHKNSGMSVRCVKD